jgi:hypothetical protein
MMHGPEKSDLAIVAGKPTNKAERSAAELVERRAGTKGNRANQAPNQRDTECCLVYSNLLPSHTRGGGRMRESRTYGFVRGAGQLASLPPLGRADRNTSAVGKAILQGRARTGKPR